MLFYFQSAGYMARKRVGFFFLVKKEVNIYLNFFLLETTFLVKCFVIETAIKNHLVTTH
jgi:hypothetical protein